MVRHKNRYMIIEINEVSKKDTDPLVLKSNVLYRSVVNMIQKLHGDFGVAATMAALSAKYCNEKTRVAIIRCRHGPHKLVASSLPLLRIIDKKRVVVNTLYTGATIKQCFKFIQRYQQKKFDEYCVGLQSEEDKEELRKAMMNMSEVLAMQ